MPDNDAYREVLVRIVEANRRDNDGQWHGTDHLADVTIRTADLYAEAATLAPPEFAPAWTTAADFQRTTAAFLRGTGDAQPPSRDMIAAVSTAMKSLEVHAQEDYGLTLMAAPPPPVGPPRPIPDEPAFDVPDGPVDEAEYQRLTADRTPVEIDDDPLQALARSAETFAAVAAVAPWEVRPAFVVMAATMQDALDRLRHPETADRPARVSPEQVSAATAIIRHAVPGA